jgi:hypothetical protein
MRFAFADGGADALVSAVAFRDRDFHFRFCPPVAINCGQINYRAYVTVDDQPGVWFFRTSLDHPVAAVPKRLWGMPWERTRIGITAEWHASPARWKLAADDARCEAVELESAPTQLDGFTDESHWMSMLTHPTVGWYRRADGRIDTYSVWHPPMRPRYFAALSAEFDVFEWLGLIEPHATPHSILAQRRLHFDIHTPPRRFVASGERGRKASGTLRETL